MMEIKVIVEAASLANAINNLAAAISGTKANGAVLESAPAVPQTTATPVPSPAVPTPPTTAAQVPTAATPAATVPTAPAPSPVPAPTPASNAVPVTPAPGVPLAQPPQYTIDQIMSAGAYLMDAGKINDLLNLLHSFGVQAVTDLKNEQLGAFATAMRGLGAKI